MLPIIVFFYLFNDSAFGAITEHPKSTEAVTGSNVTLNCRTNKTNEKTHIVEWHYKTDSNFKIVSKNSKVFNDFQGRMSVEANTATGQYNLVIKSVNLTDAGIYYCLDNKPSEEALLIVFDKYPSAEHCSVSLPPEFILGNNTCGLAPDRVMMSCNLSYHGNLGLTVEWMNGDHLLQSTSGNINGLTTSSLELIANKIDFPSVTCRIRYIPNKIVSKLTWSTTLDVRTLTNSSTVVEGDCEMKIVNCSTSAGYDCRHFWVNGNGIVVSSNSTLDLANKPNGNYSCLAECSIRERSCIHASKHIHYQCDTAKSMGISADVLSEEAYFSMVGILIVIVLVSASAIILFLVRRRNSRRSRVDGVDCQTMVPMVQMEMGSTPPS